MCESFRSDYEKYVSMEKKLLAIHKIITNIREELSKMDREVSKNIIEKILELESEISQTLGKIDSWLGSVIIASLYSNCVEIRFKDKR